MQYLLAVLIMFCSLIWAQAQTERPNQQTHQLAIQRIQGEIKLDGQLDEAAWQNAQIADHFWEKDPRDGVQAAYQTEARITYDDRFLYVGIICYDDTTQQVIQTLKRDAGFWGSDAISVIIDPVNEASNGFMFGVNPLGVQMEALLGGGSGSGNFNNNWDNIWFVETSRSVNSWTAEMAIPFTTLRYEADATVWGLNFLRNDAKRNQFHTWAPVPRQFWGIDLGYAGQLVWDKKPPVTKSNISLIPYASANLQTDFEEDGDRTFDSAIGLDAKIALSPSLNLDLTVNPDFSQVDVDVQQTNLTRFSLFFPERRGFFLENSDLFSRFGIPPARPFFSRRIGLDEDGQVVPINWGVRLTGNVTDDLRIGLLDVQTRDTDEQLAQNYFTAAFNQRVLERSSIRGMFINRQAWDDGQLHPTDYTRNADLEFNYQSGDGSLEGWAGYHHSFRDEINEKQIFWNAGGAYTQPNFNFLVDFVTVGENYFADVGFVNRLDHYDAVRDTTIRKGYRILFTPVTFTLLPKADWIQNLNINFENAFFFFDDFSLNERNTRLFAFAELPSSASFSFGTANNEVELLYPFSFTDEGEPLPVGRYRFQDVRVGFSSDQRKFFSYSLGFEAGRFYNGNRTRSTATLRYRVQPWGNFAISAEYNTLEFPEAFGEAAIWLVGPQAEVNFSKNLFWTTFMQYNTQADNFNINSRLQWQFRPLSWFFLVYSDNYAVDVWGPKNRALIAKINYWLNL